MCAIHTIEKFTYFFTFYPFFILLQVNPCIPHLNKHLRSLHVMGGGDTCTSGRVSEHISTRSLTFSTVTGGGGGPLGALWSWVSTLKASPTKANEENGPKAQRGSDMIYVTMASHMRPHRKWASRKHSSTNIERPAALEELYLYMKINDTPRFLR